MRRKLRWLAAAALLGLSATAGAQAVGNTTSNPSSPSTGSCPPGSLNCIPGTNQFGAGTTVGPSDSTQLAPGNTTTPGTQLGTGSTTPPTPLGSETTTPSLGTGVTPGTQLPSGSTTVPGS